MEATIETSVIEEVNVVNVEAEVKSTVVVKGQRGRPAGSKNKVSVTYRIDFFPQTIGEPFHCM